MKKIVLAAVAASTLVTPAFAQNAGRRDSDRTVINAVVPYTCDIEADDEHQVTNFTSGASTSLGNLLITCNDPDGFTLSADSRNNTVAGPQGSPSGRMLATDGDGGTALLYRVVINGASLFGAPKQEDQLGSGLNAGSYVDSETIPVSLVSDGFNGPAFAGRYRDVITYTVDGN